MYDDIRQRDFSGKRVDEMTAEERREMRRRFDEFIGRLKDGGPTAPKLAAGKSMRKWDPKAYARKR